MSRLVLVLLMTACAAAAGCSSYSQGPDARPQPVSTNVRLEQRASIYASLMRKTDPSIERFFNNAAGYVIFPEVTKAGVGLAGATGKGVVYENGQPVGYATLYQGTLGPQLGGQVFTEAIFFRTPADLARFKNGEVEFAASASAVGLTRGIAAQAEYSNGIAVFTMAEEGLMFEAAIGGQKFSYRPKADR